MRVLSCWLGVLLAVVGCMGPRGDQPTPLGLDLTDSPLIPGESPAGLGERGPIESLSVTFNLLRLEFAVGAISGSKTLWNHVDEEAVGTDRAALLRRNGVRVGLGLPDAWPAVETILQVTGPAVRTPWAVAIRGQQPLVIDDGQQPRDQTIFHYAPDGRLVGKSLARSRNVFRVDHTIDPADADAVLLRVTPEIRQKDLGLRLRRTVAGMMALPAYEGEILNDLAFSLRVPQGCFLIIAAGERSDQASLVGRAFMTADTADGRHEFVYIVRPMVVRTELRPA